MLLDLMERFSGLDMGGVRATSAIWPSILPADRSELARTEVVLVSAGIHARQTAVAALGDEDPLAEWERVRDEQREPQTVTRARLGSCLRPSWPSAECCRVQPREPPWADATPLPRGPHGGTPATRANIATIDP